MSERRYRGEPSRPIPVWNGILEHLQPMGMAIWLYLWCLDRITQEREGVGYVLGGAPVKVEKIAEELGRSARALRRDLGKLRSRYLRLRWTPYGYVIGVLNSRKFGIWKLAASPAKNGEARDKSGEARTKNGRAVTENGRSKEDTAIAAVDAAAKQQPAGASKPGESVWSFLGIDPCGPLSFRQLLETRWASRNGEPLGGLLGEVVDAWKATNGRIPPRTAPFFQALAKVRKRDRKRPAEAIVQLEVPA
ncbi:MAG: hypothetical protein WBC04_18400 [Candidatus Acidiferrales bacterium]